MKILLLTTHLEVGGISVYVTALARGLKRAGLTPIVASAGGWWERQLADCEIPHHRIDCRTSSELNPKLWIRALPELLRLARMERPDLIHAHTRVTQVLGWALSGITGIPYVTTCHGLYRFRIGRRLFRCWGEAVMAISGPSMDRLVYQYRLSPPHRVTLIRNGIEVDRFVTAPPAQEVQSFKERIGLSGNPVIGAIARLSPVKGLDLILQSVPKLLASFPGLQVLLVGDGPAREELVRLAYHLGIQERVVIAHPVVDTRIPLAAMDLFLAPSFREGFGLAIVEAMAAGVPVVASNAGGPAEIIEDGVSGLLIPPGDSEPMEEAIRRLLTDRPLRGRMTEKARERAVALFDMKRVVGEVEKVYRKVVKGVSWKIGSEKGVSERGVSRESVSEKGVSEKGASMTC